MNIPMTDEQQVELMLSRMLYLTYSNHRGKDPKPAPYVPEWALAYAKVAIAYLGFDGEALTRLSEDYK